MFEKTLWKISNADDNETFEKELLQFYADMVTKFKAGEFNADIMLPLWTELVPPDIDQLKQMLKRLDEIFPEDPKKKNGYTSAQGAYVFTQLLSAVTNRLNILEGRTEYFQQTMKNMEAEIKELKRKIARNEHTPEERLPDILKSKEKELELYKRGARITKGISSSSDSAKETAKLERITILIASFNDISAFVPADMQSKIAQEVYSLHEGLTELQKLTSEEDNKAFRTLFDKVSLETNKNILQLINSVNMQLQKTKNQISQSTYTRLNIEITRLANFAPLLSADSDRKTYQLVVDTFVNMFRKLVHDIKHSPNAPKEKEQRSNEEKATKHADNDIDPAVYPFQMTGAALRQSKNEYYVDQLTLNRVEIANKNKFIVTGKLNDNLFQIKADVERSLRINGKQVPAEIFKDNDKLKQFLMTELGAENAANLIRHYDQTIAILISGSIGRSGGSNEMGGIEFNPNGHTENIYVKDGVLLRDAAVEDFKIFVPDHPNSDERWSYKTKVKILSTLSADGFEVVRVGTDDPFICNSILQQSSHPDLKDLLKKVVDYEAQLFEKKSKFEDEKKATQKLTLTNKALGIVDQFKKGQLTLGQFKEGISALSNEPTPHIGVVGQIRGKVGTPTGIIKLLTEFSASLEKVKQNIDEKAVKYNVGIQNSPKNSPSPLSINRS